MTQKSNAAFTVEEVRKIKRDLIEGRSRKQLARAYGVGLETISRIARGDTWADIDPLEPTGQLPSGRKLEAELLAPSNLDDIAERLIQVRADEVICPGCLSGFPLQGAQHLTPVGVLVDCLKRRS